MTQFDRHGLLVKAAVVLTIACGVLVLVGWTLDIPLIRSVLPGAVEMKANTAVCLILAGVALFVAVNPAMPYARSIAPALALAISAIGLATLSEYAFGWNLGIDELLFRDSAVAYNAAPGRMSPYSAAVFGAVGLALAALPRAGLRVVVWLLTVPVVLIGVVSLLGYLWNASEIVTDTVLPPVAVNTAATFVLIGFGILGATRSHLQLPARPAPSPLGDNVQREVLIGFIAATGVLIVGFGLFYRSISQFAETEGWVVHSQGVLKELSDLYADVSDAESAQRNYMLTTSSEHKDKYAFIITEVRRHLDNLRAMTIDNSAQVQRVSDLDSIIRSRLALLTGTNAVFEEMGLVAAREMVSAGEGLLLMEEIREIKREMETLEGALLSQRQGAADRERTQILICLLLMLLGIGAIFALLFYAIHRALTLRATRESEIRDLNAELQAQIGERNLALDALHNKEQEVRAIVDNLLDGIVTTTADGTIRGANAALSRLLGYAREEIVGRNIAMFIPEAAGGAPGDDRSLYQRRGEPGAVGLGREVEGRHKDGRPIAFELGVSEYELRGERLFVGVLRDIRERKRFVAELLRSHQEAERANRAKSAFLATMSHEIRTPLNGIIGNLELLALTDLDDGQVDLLDDANKAGLALLGLIGNILDFSKIEEGKFVFETGDVDVAALTEEAVHVLQSKARQKGVFIVATYAPDVPRTVRADGPRIRQILLNLIGNAVKFTDRGGIHVHLSVTAWDQDVCEICFAVHDSGSGFAQADADKLFEPFTQDNPNPWSNEGSGLGLSICRSLLENFGGSISCEGEPGGGATFTVTLPAAIVARADPVIPADLAGRSALIVGGLPERSLRMQNYFKSRGAVADAVGHGASDYACTADTGAANRRPYDVVLFISDDVADFQASCVRQWRDHQVVPVIHGPRASSRHHRQSLCAGFAVLIPDDAAVDYLDLNIRRTLGYAPSGGRTTPEPARLLTAEGREHLERKRVLVLEDRLVNQTVIQKQLKILGIACTLASNGVKGLEAVRSSTFDLILCDCSMPEMNGFDFTRALRRLEAEAGGIRRTPVVALTANAFREDAEECFEAGMDDFVSKPVNIDRLAAVLIKWLRTAPPAAPSPALQRWNGAGERPAIDIGALAEMMGIDDPSAIDEILGQFSAAARDSLIDVQTSVRTGQPDRVVAAAHSAKGEAQSAAATVLANCYSEMERRAKAGEVDDLPRLGAMAAAELGRVEAFIQGIQKGAAP